jgi:ABC-type bacteriocin/lantibiotic exporter with double-glycine peptidase domain
MELPIIKAIYQRYGMDCGVACLAMICGVTYETALVAVARKQPDVCAAGVWSKHLVAGADHLGFTLRKRQRFDLDADTGILNVSSPAWRNDHLVVLWEGRIIDTDAGFYMQDVYFSINNAKATALFVAERKT